METIGDYELLQLLRAGCMGKVYQVRNTSTRRVEAMKVLLPELTADHDLTERFLTQIRISASLDHPNIAALRTAQRVGSQLIVMMEYVEGSTLNQLMRSGRIPIAKGRRMTINELAALVAVILSVGTNVALYVYLSSVMNNRFDSVERRLDLIQGDTHQMDIRLTKLEAR